MALQIAAPVNPPGDLGTVFLATPHGRTKPTMDFDSAGFAVGREAIVFGDVQRVNLSSLHWISGPRLKTTPRHVYITMTSTRMSWQGAILVRTRAEGAANSFNDPRQASADWTDVRNGCVDRKAVDAWGAGALFGPPDNSGMRCLIGWKVSH